MVDVCWHAWDGNGLEHCVFENIEDGLPLSGAVVGSRLTRYGAFYFVRTDELFRTREVRVQYASGPVLHVEADGCGNWIDLVAGLPLEKLNGCIDVDIGVTPATNMLPIKRLDLTAGESREILAAYVPLPSQIEGGFVPTPAEQRYTCLEIGKRYRYDGLFRNFSAELEIDGTGMVFDYPDTFRRLR
jgi:hypothetical protein